jgi:hypothetical protein
MTYLACIALKTGRKRRRSNHSRCIWLASESFPQDNLLAVSKFLAEAKALERKTVLGWEVSTRVFKFSLPADIRRAWVGK